MAGRSGPPQSFLLSHTEPVTAQVSHFAGDQTHMWELWVLLQEVRAMEIEPMVLEWRQNI